MILEAGLDSAYPPTPAQARQAQIMRYTWWGFYLPRLLNTDPLRGWSVANKQVIDHAGLIAMPICVPSPPHPADASKLAILYFNLCKDYGITVKESVCYNGSHIAVDGPVWLPIPGPKPKSVGPRSAVQWGGGQIGGLSVDFNVSAIDFPSSSCLVVDLEYGVSYTTAWYQAFQNTIHQLGANMAGPTAKCVDLVFHPNGGYYLVGADGGVFTYDGAPFYGSTGAVKLDAPVNKMIVSPTGLGYWLIADDYGVFSFGDAKVLAHP